MGGVSASVLPATSVYVALALPDPFVTVTAIGYEPAAGVVPEMIPVDAAIVTPPGSPVALKVSGACPVAGIENSSGVVGRAPNVSGPCRRGVAGGAVMEIAIVVWARAAPDRPSAAVTTNAAPT